MKKTILLFSAFFLTGCLGQDSSPPSHLTLDPAGYAGTKAQMSLESDFDRIESAYALLDEYINVLSQVHHGLLYRAREESSQRILCENEGGYFTEALEKSNFENEVIEEVNYVFHRCDISTERLGILRLDGHWETQERTLTPQGGEMRWLSRERLQLEARFPDARRTAFNVLIDFDERFNKKENRWTSDFVFSSFEFLFGEEYLAFPGMRLWLEIHPDEEQFRVDGQVVSSRLNGYLTQKTPETLVWKEGADCPENGHFHFFGNGQGELVFQIPQQGDQGVLLQIEGHVITNPRSCSDFISLFW